MQENVLFCPSTIFMNSFEVLSSPCTEDTSAFVSAKNWCTLNGICANRQEPLPFVRSKDRPNRLRKSLFLFFSCLFLHLRLVFGVLQSIFSLRIWSWVWRWWCFLFLLLTSAVNHLHQVAHPPLHTHCRKHPGPRTAAVGNALAYQLVYSIHLGLLAFRWRRIVGCHPCCSWSTGNSIIQDLFAPGIAIHQSSSICLNCFEDGSACFERRSWSLRGWRIDLDYWDCHFIDLGYCLYFAIIAEPAGLRVQLLLLELEHCSCLGAFLTQNRLPSLAYFTFPGCHLETVGSWDHSEADCGSRFEMCTSESLVLGCFDDYWSFVAGYLCCCDFHLGRLRRSFGRCTGPWLAEI